MYLMRMAFGPDVLHPVNLEPDPTPEQGVNRTFNGEHLQLLRL
jgi:hypothetical protein